MHLYRRPGRGAAEGAAEVRGDVFYSSPFSFRITHNPGRLRQ